MAGVQEPRVLVAPLVDDWTAGDDALFLINGLQDQYGAPLIELMPWQELVVVHTFALRDQLWASTDLGLIVARQNGKGGVLEAIVLCHLILFGARRVFWTAQLQTTSDDAHKRMAKLFEECPELNDLLDKSSRDGGITYGSGKKTIRLKTGQEILFFTRTANAGRGLFGDLLILDESYDLTDEELAALSPTLKTAANPQFLYTSTPPDEEVHPNGIVLARLRKASLKQLQEQANAEALQAIRRGWLEWSVPEGVKVNPDNPDTSTWSLSNPSLGYLFTMETLLGDLGRLGKRKFQVEDLCAPDFWPDPDESGDEDRPISMDAFRLSSDPSSVPMDPVALGIDQPPGGRKTALVAVGHRPDGRVHIETIAHAEGNEWVPSVLLDMIQQENAPAVLVIDAMSAAASLLPRLKAIGIEPYVTGTSELCQASASFADDWEADRYRHRGNDAPLTEAVEIVRWRTVGKEGQRAFARSGYGDVAPAVAGALAGFGLDAFVAAGGPVAPPPPPVPVAREAVPEAHWGGTGDFEDIQTVGF